MDKISLEEMIEYSKEIVYYYRNKYNLSNDEKDTMVTRTREIKSKLYDDLQVLLVIVYSILIYILVQKDLK